MKQRNRHALPGFFLDHQVYKYNLSCELSRSEPTKPGDQSMAGFDVIKNIMKSGDQSTAGLDFIKFQLSQAVITLWHELVFSTDDPN